MRSKTAIHTIATLALVLASTGLAQAQKPQTPVNGQGTAGKVTKWTSATTVGDSNITEDKFGRVGIGVEAPTTRLAVAGVIESVSGGGGVGGGFKFPDGSIQKSAGLGANQIVGSENIIVTPSGNTVVISAEGLLKIGDALTSVVHDETLVGDGSADSPLGIAAPLELRTAADNSAVLSVENTLDGDGIFVRAGDDLVDGGFGGDGISVTGGNVGVGGLGGTGIAVFGGESTGPDGVGGTAIFAIAGVGNDGARDGSAATLIGNASVSGVLEVAGNLTRKIDHPLDPENRFLSHAAVESSEVLNVYSGNVTTDAAGVAVIALPDWFEAVNTDLRYQLTVLGDTFARAVVSRKVADNRFTIKTDAPSVEVSWQVTGVRADAASKRAPFAAVEDKSAAERGLYLTPEAFGQPAGRGISRSRYAKALEKAGH